MKIGAFIDLNRPPYRVYVEHLDRLRAGQSRELFSYGKAEQENLAYDKHHEHRQRLTYILQLKGKANDVELIRFLLDAEITARENNSLQGASDTLSILSMLLLEFCDAHSDDIWRFWKAKRANFDTYAGGYDIEFVFAQLAPDAVKKLLQERSDDALDSLKKYETSDIVKGIPSWRHRLRAHHFPRTIQDFALQHHLVWAEAFADAPAIEQLGLQASSSAEDRARLFQRLERNEDALKEWRAAAVAATSNWDRASRLRDVLNTAAKIGAAALEDVAELDALRPAIESWNKVGLGRMATQALYELASATEDANAGRQIWDTAERWRNELDSFTLAGLRTAVNAAHKWGKDTDVAALEDALRQEHDRIYGSQDGIE